MFVELHILQNFAPSNLNRDDTGAPKDCEFGGYRRARVSSQCLKRAVRKESGFLRFLGEKGAVRTRRLVVEIAERLSEKKPADPDVMKIVSEVFKEGGLDRAKSAKGEAEAEAEKDNTSLILFMDHEALGQMVGTFQSSWSQLKASRKETRGKIIAELGESLAKAVKAPDIALFGRMIEIDASKPFGKLQLGVDASCQVAHAISTHKLSGNEFDYFTAVDDLLPEADTGAGMIGTVEFNSACFYRYANVDLGQLLRNLGGDQALARKTLEAFIRASVAAIPTGKQNSMASQNPPSFVMAVAREHGLWSLANAFLNPVRADATGDLVRKSIESLDNYWGQLTQMYGNAGIVGNWFAGLDARGLKQLGNPATGFDEVLESLMAKVAFNVEERAA
jgi:CRISPR system Cascade subunit CasC